MAFVTADRVRDTSTTAGSGSFSVSGTAPSGYRTFSAVLSVSDTFYYSIQHQTLDEWEVGLGTYSSANTFARTTIYSSSNAGSAVTFSAGTKDVFITMAASRSPQLNASGNVTALGTPTSVNLTNATNLPLASGVSGTLPTANGGLGASVSPTTAGNVLFTADGSVWSSTQKIVQGTSVASTSGTSITFTGLPAWVKRITVMLNGVSTNGSSIVQIQIGSGSFTTTGYLGTGFIAADASTPAVVNMSSGFLTSGFGAATYVRQGGITLANFSGNTWVAFGVVGQSESTRINMTGGSLALSGALDRVRLTTVNGTDTFDAGSVNILYE
jgi:hypothetical protein